MCPLSVPVWQVGSSGGLLTKVTYLDPDKVHLRLLTHVLQMHRKAPVWPLDCTQRIKGHKEHVYLPLSISVSFIQEFSMSPEELKLTVFPS